MTATARVGKPLVAAHRTKPSIARHIVTAAVSLLAFLVYSAVSLTLQASMRTGVDLTIFTQAVQAYSKLEIPNVLVKAQEPFNILGDHFSPIVALLGVGYGVWPDVRVLLVGQAFLMALGVFLVGRFAVSRLGWWGLPIAVAFATSWGVLEAVAFDFHEIAFAVPILVVAIAALLLRKDAWLLGACVLLLLVKEDSAFLVAGLALCLIVMRRFRMGAILGAGSIAYFLAAVYWIIPSLSYYGRYTYFGNLDGGPFRNLLSNVTSPDVILYISALALTCGIGLTSPVVLVLLPTILARLVTNNVAYLDFGDQYHATLMVVCFMALIDGLERLRRFGYDTRIAVLTIQTLAAVAIAVGSLAGSSVPTILAKAGAPCPRCQAVRALTSEIPEGATVAADVYLMPQLVDHHQVMMAVPGWTDSTGAPLKAEWVLLDLSVNAGGGPTGWEEAEKSSLLAIDHYSLKGQSGDFVLLEKSH